MIYILGRICALECNRSFCYLKSFQICYMRVPSKIPLLLFVFVFVFFFCLFFVYFGHPILIFFTCGTRVRCVENTVRFNLLYSLFLHSPPNYVLNELKITMVFYLYCNIYVAIMNRHCKEPRCPFQTLDGRSSFGVLVTGYDDWG